MVDAAQSAVGDQLPSQLHRGCIPIVEAGGGVHTAGTHSVADRSRLGCVTPGRLLHPQMLPGLGRGNCYVTVDEVGAGHAHRVDIVAGNKVPPVRMRILEPEDVDRAGQSVVRRGVGDSDQARPQRSLRIVLSQPGVRPRVHLTHPTPPNNAHP